MYAMDHTSHFEHRSDERHTADRRSRWDLRRSWSRAATSGTAVLDAPASDDDSPTHEFLD
jgi:hypothetical protein